MASRRDELNAYTFAKKRTVAAFLQPSAGGSEEGAPRPLRTVLPGIVVGALLVAGFGAWGVFRPVAPKGWDDEAAHVIVGSDSTTRYVVLVTDGKKQLHPVLNLASAKLLLNPGKSQFIKVRESELDDGHIPRGPTLGIPYAPDRMPSDKEAGKEKRWAVCQQPGGTNGNTTQKAVFLFAAHDPKGKTLDGPQRLRAGQALYVEGPDEARYLVDPRGTRYAVGAPDGKSGDAADRNLLLRALFRDGAQPQHVTKEWLATLNEGTPITFPEVPGQPGRPAGIPSLGDRANRVGMVLQAPTGTSTQHYVVLPGKVARVSAFTAKLLLSSKTLASLGQAGTPERVSPAAFTPDAEEFAGQNRWPTLVPRQVNFADPLGTGRPNDTVCSLLTGMNDDGTPELGVWAGKGYPATVPDGATSAYVTPGSGLLYRQVTGRQTQSGTVFLVTDTGLRYAVQSNSDSGTAKSRIGDAASAPPEPGEAGAGGKEADQARVRLGYQKVAPVAVPANWSQFLPTGPRLDTNSARQPQGS
ncbi:type VII secretion protein EccB [Streptomyces mashuensis]|uniref:Type VII secretion protein EccB n=1 Tax=Streptomyces mashuensis TaxID=33904 RepID=A0A919BB46_9ACTN|nr:type VII secretion protein EccB [Streptomyces mashuensis]GHF74781.1 type VII secretion protein EccB [Streptomyces mashuensis]